MSGLEVHTDSPRATEASGRLLGAALEPGDLVALDGVLGAGKTCFVRGLLAGLGGRPEEVRSPTFVIHQVHLGGRLPLHHLDLYRLGDGAELAFLDLDELLEGGVVAVEWAERAERAELAPLTPIRLRFSVGDLDSRAIRLEPGAPERVLRAWEAAGA